MTDQAERVFEVRLSGFQTLGRVRFEEDGRLAEVEFVDPSGLCFHSLPVPAHLQRRPGLDPGAHLREIVAWLEGLGG